MNPETETRLRARYARDIEELERLSGIGLVHLWRYARPRAHPESQR
jgi:hypothetical protein